MTAPARLRDAEPSPDIDGPRVSADKDPMLDLDFSCSFYVPSKKGVGNYDKIEGDGKISVNVNEITWEVLQEMCAIVSVGANRSLTVLLRGLFEETDDDDEFWGMYVTKTKEYKKAKESRRRVNHGPLSVVGNKVFDGFLKLGHEWKGIKPAGVSFDAPDPKKGSKTKQQVSFCLNRAFGS